MGSIWTSTTLIGILSHIEEFVENISCLVSTKGTLLAFTYNFFVKPITLAILIISCNSYINFHLNTPKPICLSLFILNIHVIARIEPFPLHQLMMYVDATAPDKVAKDVAIFNQWPPTHHLETYCCSRLSTGRMTLQDEADGVFERISSWQLDVDSLNSHLSRELSKQQ